MSAKLFLMLTPRDSVEMVSTFVKTDLEGLNAEQLESHIERARAIFEKTAYKTNGVLTYYYRVDPSVSSDIKGFWYTNLDGNGFVEHEATDITLYDTEDTSKLVWFTVPKATEKSIWLPPYVTDNLNVRVISYNVPIYMNDVFLGVVGIEIDYSTMAEQVDKIKLYKNGYAFITDENRELVYHPLIDVTVLDENSRPEIPEGASSGNTYARYTFDGVEKLAVRLPLSNGMIFNVAVPVSEINGDWQSLIYQMLIVMVIVLLFFSLLALRFTGHITKPLKELADAAEEVDAGNYDVSLDYDSKDEVGTLARTFNKLIAHLKGYIGDLNDLAYGDALTSVRNKGAFDIYLRGIQTRMDDPEEEMRFAVAMFDCNDLKAINDTYGHDKGDAYLKSSCRLICRVFHFSPVFRIGGDEFAAILRDDDFEDREELAKLFAEKSEQISAKANKPWQKISVAMGIAVYDPDKDRTVKDVVRRADMLMYNNKTNIKAEAKRG